MKTFTYSISLSFLLIVLLNACQESHCSEQEDSEVLDTVTTKYGNVQGIPLTSRKGRTYYGFLGIPYGKIPERFEVGEKPDSWDGVKEVKTLPPPCFHYFIFTHQMTGVEDCLHLNVYSPKPKSGKKLPVFFFLFPGGFQFGGGSTYEAKYVMDQDVVFVSINYRLGALGFLNTGDGSVTGNMGMKDQVLALEWVKDNIDAFGGDPNLVTIFGLSAGGASVDYLTISPMAKGLFHRAIALSGSSLNPWAFQQNPSQIAETFAENAGCSQTGWEWNEKLSCLREKEPSAIVNAQNKLMKHGFDFDFLHMKFVPSKEESENVKGPKFLTDSPYNLLSRGEIASKVPFMTGLTENEGAFFVATIMKNEKLYQKLDSDWNSMVPYILYYDDSVSSSSQGKVSKSVRDFYLGGRPLSPSTKKGFTDLYSDRFFGNGIAKGLLLHSKHQPVFPYIFDYQGQHSFTQFAFGIKDREGAVHCDDLIYMFNCTLGAPDIALGSRDGDFSEKYWSLLVSFAKNGKPTGTWGPQKEWPAQEGNKNKPITYYKLDLDDTKLLKDPLASRRQFWNTLPIREHEKVGLEEGKEEL